MKHNEYITMNRWRNDYYWWCNYVIDACWAMMIVLMLWYAIDAYEMMYCSNYACQ
jgi:hypothetical protein